VYLICVYMRKREYKTTATFRLNKKLKREIKRHARLNRMSPSAFIERLVMERFLKYLQDVIRTKELAND